MENIYSLQAFVCFGKTDSQEKTHCVALAITLHFPSITGIDRLFADFCACIRPMYYVWQVYLNSRLYVSSVEL